MRIVRSSTDWIMVPEPGDRLADIVAIVEELERQVPYEWRLDVTTRGEWALVNPIYGSATHHSSAREET